MEKAREEEEKVEKGLWRREKACHDLSYNASPASYYSQLAAPARTSVRHAAVEEGILDAFAKVRSQ